MFLSNAFGIFLVVLIVAIFIDLIIGDPEYRWHPVRIIGNVITLIEKFLFAVKMNGYFGGVILYVVTVAVTLSLYLFIIY